MPPVCRAALPGHGIRMVLKDGKMVLFINSKARNMYKQRKKPANLGWTLAWRKGHKKLTTLERNKRRTRRRRQAPRAIAGMNMEELSKRRKKAFHKVTAETSTKMVKEKVKKKKGMKKQFGSTRIARNHAGKGRGHA